MLRIGVVGMLGDRKGRHCGGKARRRLRIGAGEMRARAADQPADAGARRRIGQRQAFAKRNRGFKQRHQS